ncbi:MAG: DNA cytosine methyltransferase [Achromobacter mucicolens]
MKKHTRPIGIDLFAGAGGLSLGFEQAGFDIAAAVEIDPVHCATHEFNFPNCTTICESVVNLSGNDIRTRAQLGDQEIHVVFGGAPCQGFSMIGKRALDDPRNQLVFHYVRLVRELQPQYCVFENVKGLTLGAHSKFLQELINALDEAGYEVLLPYRVLNAADFNVPQDRRRLFLIGTRRGGTPPEYPKPTGRVTVEEAIIDLPNADNYDILRTGDSVRVKWDTTSSYARYLRGLDEDPTDYSCARSFDQNLLTSSMRTNHSVLSKTRFNETAPGETEPVSRFRRLALDGLCNTLRAGTDSARGAFTSPRPIHPILPRVITVREAARLHSYPDWFRFHVTKWHGFRQIGNSVPPHLARAVGSEIMKAMDLTPCKPAFALPASNAALLELDMSGAAGYFGVRHTVIAQRLRKPGKTKIPEQQLAIPESSHSDEEHVTNER